MSKLKKEDFYGVSNLPLTALNADRTINVESTEKYIDFLVEREATFLWFMGFLGECVVLPMEHKKKLIDIYSSYAKGRVLTGAGAHSQKACECIELANYADKKGCDFAWITPPWPPACHSYEDILNHYREVIANTSIDLALYSSGGTGIYMPPTLIKEVINLAPDRFVALKDSQGILAHISELFRIGVPDMVAFLPVAGEQVYSMALGTKSVICTPEQQMLSVALFKAMEAGDQKKAMHYQHRLMGGFPLLAYWGSALSIPGLTMPYYMYAQKEACEMITGIPLGPYMAESPRPKEMIEKMKKYVQWWNPLDIDAPLPDTEWGYMM